MNHPPFQMPPQPPVGVGAPRVQKIGVGWRGLTPQAMAQYSPQIALAIAQGCPFAPYLLNVRASFTDSTVTVLAPATLENGNARIDQPSVVDALMLHIDAPNQFPGTQFKPLTDWFYTRQSGIQATLDVTGAPRYSVAPFFTPIDTLATMITESWPFGWVLGHTQGIAMQFQATTPLPPLPVNITISFRLWQPMGTEEFVDMTSMQAFQALAAMGIDVSMYQNAPVAR